MVKKCYNNNWLNIYIKYIDEYIDKYIYIYKSQHSLGVLFTA